MGLQNEGCEVVEMGIARGLRAAGSPKLAGPVMSNKPMRRYDVTVERNGRPKKAKDAIREAGKGHFDLRREPGAEEILDERFLFRRERAQRFQVGCHFPALVGGGIIPSWKGVSRQVD